MTQRISLLIPVGRFSYFVHACLQNVLETCGAPDALDFVFLTNRTVPTEISKAFEDASKTYPFRVIAAPLEVGSAHMHLLDWAMRYADLTEWVIIQHCDLFWQERNWLGRILGEIKPELTVLCPSCPSRDHFGSQNIPLVGDAFGVYNRSKLIEQNLWFRWGVLGHDVPVSLEVINAVQSGLIRRDGQPVSFGSVRPRQPRPVSFGSVRPRQPRLRLRWRRPPLIGKEWMDGSVAMSWELAVHDPQGVWHFRPPLNQFHLWSFFRFAERVRRKGNRFWCDVDWVYPYWLGWYSYVTSFCIERSEIEGATLPWAVYGRLAQLHGWPQEEPQKIGEWLRKYSVAHQVVGLDDLGIERVVFKGKVLAARPVKPA
jgi:hypothetical protein